MRHIRSALFAALLVISLPSALVVEARTRQSHTAQAVVHTYFQLLNQGLRTGDFSPLLDLYAPDGMLTQSTPLGVTTVFHSRSAIRGYYTALAAKYPGIQFTSQTMRRLDRSVVISYELAASPQLPTPGHCAHVFTVRAGHIQSLDWVTFAAPKP